MGHRVRWRSSSEAETPSARGLSDFRRLFLRVRRRPSAKQQKAYTGFSIVRRDVEGPSSATQADRRMQRANSILLRSVFSAAVVCAVLRAATLGGADRAGSLPNGNVRETGPILVRSISTIKSPVCSATRNLISESAPALAEGHGEAALHSCANVAPPIDDRSKPAHKPPGVVALTFLNLGEPPARLDALSTNLIGFGKSRDGIIGRRGASPSSDPISQSCVAEVRGPE